MELSFHELLAIETLTENRLDEIERLSKEHPNLPMKDPATVALYTKLLEKVREELKTIQADV